MRRLGVIAVLVPLRGELVVIGRRAVMFGGEGVDGSRGMHEASLRPG
jgi:hypothetical protein